VVPGRNGEFNEAVAACDTNGDGSADFAILVHSSTALVAGDFVL